MIYFPEAKMNPDSSINKKNFTQNQLRWRFR